MTSPDDKFFVFENRLASFRGPHTVAKGKTLQWPHKSLSPVALAKAGFFFEPHLQSPDNVVCFLCDKSLDGWEEGDNPLEEHLKHSPTCGWAITAAIETGYGNYGKVHPLDPAMVEARKATFAGRWPYESKKGFKCKTKKLVEAGWKYTPSLDEDDMATCTYCDLALEGWESDDNPYDEHLKREPGCQFFVLISQYPAPKKGRAKAARTSKASSRLSVQSVATVATTASDIASAADITDDHDDSAMTTASTMTQGGKKTTKGKKAATGKGRKTKAKKDEAIEILEDEPPAQNPPRGRKRTSDAVEDSAATSREAPAPKKRATRASNAVDNSNAVAPLPDTEMADAAPAKPAAKKKARASTTKKTRKASGTSVRSQASTASMRDNLPDDDEIDRQLEAELERYQSDAEEIVEKAPAPTKGRPKKAATARKTSTQREKGQSESYGMFNPTPMVPDEAEIEADFEAMRAEMVVEQPAPTEGLVVKKGRKAGVRKVSKSTKKAKEPVPQPDPVEVVEDAPLPDAAQDQKAEQPQPELEEMDDPDVSTGTVVTKTVRRLSSERPGRGRLSKKSTASQAAAEEPEQRRSSGHVEAPRTFEPTSAPKITRKPVPVASQPQAPAPIPAPAAIPTASTPTKTEKALPAPPSSTNRFPQPPSTPRSARITPSRFANQAAISPSQSPQSSDAENRPPAAATTLSKQIVLSHPTTVATTPMRSTSPSKRNVVAGLQSTAPWQPADMDTLFALNSSPNREGDAMMSLVLRKQSIDGSGEGALASPEKRMTVEEWIYHNAELAEQQLKRECEEMVSLFEREGSRAMRVLEGLVVE